MPASNDGGRSGRRRHFQLLASLSLALAALVGPACAEDAVIAVAAPMTGPHAGLGTAIRTAVATALEAATRTRDLAPSFTLRVVDDACLADTATATAQILRTQQVSVVIGHPCGSASAAASKIYSAGNMLFLSLSRHPAALPNSPGLRAFRLTGRDDRQGSAMAAHLLAGPQPPRIAVLHDRTTYGQAIARDLVATLQTRGQPAALTEGIVAGEKDYAAALGRIEAAGVRAIAFAGYPAEAAVIARQIAARNTGMILLTSDANATLEFPRLADSAAEGTFVAIRYVPAATPQSRDAVDDVPPSPDSLAANAASLAVRTWLSAIAATGSTNPQAVAAHLLAQGGAPSRDAVVFDANGDAALPGFAVYAWRGGRLVPASR